MRQTLLTFALLAFVSVAVFAVERGNVEPTGTNVLYAVELPNQTVVTMEDIMEYKPRQLAKKYDIKLNLKQRVALGIARSKLRKAERRGEDLSEAFRGAAEGGGWWHWGGFILGLLLGIIGWLIAIIVWPGQGAGTSALIGMLIWVAVGLVFIL